MSDPRYTLGLYGHTDAEATFRQAVAGSKLHHAWLICGPAGIGKATLAFRLARMLLNAEHPDSSQARRIAAGTHGDLLEISRAVDEKKGRLRGEITAADVRPVQTFLHHTATEGGWRVVIVDGAEYLNRFAANALLKILEEPPPRCVLLLTTSSPGALLPTIRSRCRMLTLSALSDTDMRAALPGISADVLARAHGSPGRALFLSQDRDGAIASFVAGILSGQVRASEAMVLSERIAKEAEGFALLCDLLGEGLADRARSAARHGDLAKADLAARQCSELDTLRRQTEGFNLDKAQAIRQAAELASGS
ncbi:DNA polymerase III subunit delta' [Gluconobacter sphaericus]|uniref:DNA polymerase III subunit delta n=1 Tax=Gluconobacter sphaericus NBRC 12467 TaxID=1307951 RepID=A0AA37WAF1_9PROT|nr:DNA polymerase III subunit delta' [Gluconobacter sphaericus]MBF0885341.1 DNA polymerase III subunit delta' [Gluconobacter sphaericus]GBR56119.1 DNA polymerase III subunit delta' [Gluconobacter sphaericus NBRC 12467]GEB42082.1 DNA polymerase III subunit delta' [Gluconobacter sphaericus NBRC 12467]GLQ84551.1 DNA polymerase III subunit delta' [Gluconobacter sphaericus NBRC 12467]GLQ85295.1 DNA polymerase III subunit delta' [Gluconobacter sphaericus NBRC 12467]